MSAGVMPRGSAGVVPWRMILLASFGGALEFFDFVLFGVFSPAIAAAFFPAADPLVSQMLAFAGFAVGYLARPVGGLVLAHFGDRFGRRRVFVGSMLAVSLATLAMGLVPGYATWGIAAPTVLLVLRLVQGFCLGGELAGAITYVVETVPARASFVCGVVFASVNSGVLLATLLSLAVQLALPADVLPQFGWRLGFLLGGALGLVGFRLRRALAETPAFLQMRDSVARVPLREVLASHAWPAAVGIATTAATAGFNGLLFVHMPGYLRGLHYDPVQVGWAQNAGIAVLSVGLLAVAGIGDHVPRRWLIGAGAALLLAGCWPWYAAVAAHSMPLVPMLMLAGLAASWVNGVFAVVVADLFPTRLRYSGVALSYNVSLAVFSGTAPLLAAVAMKATGAADAPALVMGVCAALALFGSFWVGRHAGRLRD
jgi:MFS family permease